MWDLLSACIKSTARQTSSQLVLPVVHLKVPLMVEFCLKIIFLSPPSPNLRVFGIVMKTFAQVSIALNLKIKAVLSQKTSRTLPLPALELAILLPLPPGHWHVDHKYSADH